MPPNGIHMGRHHMDGIGRHFGTYATRTRRNLVSVCCGSPHPATPMYPALATSRIASRTPNQFPSRSSPHSSHGYINYKPLPPNSPHQRSPVLPALEEPVSFQATVLYRLPPAKASTCTSILLLNISTQIRNGVFGPHERPVRPPVGGRPVPGIHGG